MIYELLVEFKVGNEIKNQHIQQVLGYLKTNKYKLGIIALMSEKGEVIKRIIN